MAGAISFGAWIRRRRRHLDLTQEMLADQVGCSPVTIRKLESDERRPSKQLAERLATFLAIPPEEQIDFVAFARNIPYDKQIDDLPKQELEQSRLIQAPLSRMNHTDWGEAPDATNFYGRTAEKAELHRWLRDDRCQLIAVLGIGGIGKTTLAMKAAQEVQDHFDAVLWRSLRNSPPVTELLDQCLYFLTNEPAYDRTTSIDRQLDLLIDCLRQRRCLIVLDNMEAVMAEGERAGIYRPGYEGYGQFLQTVGEVLHRGTLLITSREKPREIALLEGANVLVRSVVLSGLSAEAAYALLLDKGVSGAMDKAWVLSQRYSGNPLALKIVAETIRELFSSDIGTFLQEEITIFGDVWNLLTAQFARLSPLEQEMLLWLAIEREPTVLEELRANFVQSVNKSVLFDLLNSLRRRSLVEHNQGGFTLQNVVMEFLTEYLVKQVCEEVLTRELNYIQSHALMKAQAKEYVRESQLRLLLQPIAERLLATLDKVGVEQQLRLILMLLRTNQLVRRGYTGGNVLNLLLYLKSDLTGWDFSDLAVWQAYVRGTSLHDVSFQRTDLSKSRFTTAVGPCISIRFSLDGTQLVAGSSGGEICVWQVSDGEPLLRFLAHWNWIHSLCFSPDGNFLVSAGADGTICLWDMPNLLAAPYATAQPFKRLLGHSNHVTAIEFRPNSHTIASGSFDHTVRLWDVDSGEVLLVLQGHTAPVWSICFSPDGKWLASSGEDGVICLWEVETGRCLHTLQDQTVRIAALAFSFDGSILASAGNDTIVHLWDPRQGVCVHMLEGHMSPIESLSFHPRSHLLASGGMDGSVRIWHVRSRECLHALQAHNSSVWSIRFSPSGTTLATGSDDQSLCLWDIQSGHCLNRIEGYLPWLWSLHYSPDGHLLASADDHNVHLWDPLTGQSLRLLQGHRDRVNAVRFHPDGRRLASAGHDRTIRLWDLSTGRCLSTMWGHMGGIWSLSFDPNSKILASCAFDYTVRLWNIDSGQCIGVLRGHTDIPWSVSFSPTGDMVASAGMDKAVRLWNAQSTLCLLTLEGHEGGIWSVAFSPDGCTLASGSMDHTLRIWNAQTGHCLRSIQAHEDWVTGVSFSPDGRLLASCSDDTTVRLWNSQTGACVHLLAGHTKAVFDISFSPDGQWLASSSADQTVRLWNISSGECVRIMHSKRPYENMDITGVTGVTQAQIAILKQLGAVENPSYP